MDAKPSVRRRRGDHPAGDRRPDRSGGDERLRPNEQERSISSLVFHGHSTRAISETLHITQHTVQDHLKSIFEKTGVRSRRELVATVLRQQYLPRAKAGQHPGPSGYFPIADSGSAPHRHSQLRGIQR